MSMTVLTLLHPMANITTPSSTSQQQQQQQKIPLRRATYIHISDLTSAYNIDNVQLEKEMARVNAKRNKLQDASSHTNEQDESSKDDDGKTGTPDKDQDLDVALGPIVHQKRLQPPRGGFNLCILVGKINIVVDKSRVDRSRVRLAEVEIGDETGTVSLRARDDQIDLLERVSKCKPGAVVLRNCTLELYQGKHIRLAVTKWGKLNEYPDNVASTPGPPPTMNLDRNYSLIDLSLVASEIIEKKLKDSTLQSHASTNRQTKISEDEKASGSGSLSRTSSTSKSGQQTHTKNQQQSQSQSQTSRRGSNRSSKERRQSQSRGSHYGGMTTDTNQNQPPHQQGKVMYHGGIQGYYGYEQHHQQHHQQQQQQSIDMRMRQQQQQQQQYPPTSYTHSTRVQQDVVSAQYALRQQYEMQQRQLHQLYSRDEIAPMLLRPISSYEASTGSYAGNMSEHHQHQMMTGVGNSHMMVGIPRGNVTETSSSPKIGRTSPFVIGQMNPEAMSYAPSYQGPNPQQQVSPEVCPPQYNYDPSRHTFYAPGTMYPHTPHTIPNHPMDQGGKPST